MSQSLRKCGRTSKKTTRRCYRPLTQVFGCFSCTIVEVDLRSTSFECSKLLPLSPASSFRKLSNLEFQRLLVADCLAHLRLTETPKYEGPTGRLRT